MNLTEKDYREIMSRLDVISEEIKEIEEGNRLPDYDWHLADDALSNIIEIQRLLTLVRWPAPEKEKKPARKGRQK